MAFDGLLRWFEKNHQGKHVHPGHDTEMTAVEHPADGTWSPVIGETQPDITSEGGVKLPPISGGVPDGTNTSSV